MFRKNKLSIFKVKKIIWCFCVDINASKTDILLRQEMIAGDSKIELDFGNF